MHASIYPPIYLLVCLSLSPSDWYWHSGLLLPHLLFCCRVSPPIFALLCLPACLSVCFKHLSHHQIPSTAVCFSFLLQNAMLHYATLCKFPSFFFKAWLYSTACHI